MGNRQTIVIVLFSNQISPVRKNGLVKFIALFNKQQTNGCITRTIPFYTDTWIIC